MPPSSQKSSLHHPPRLLSPPPSLLWAAQHRVFSTLTVSGAANSPHCPPELLDQCRTPGWGRAHGKASARWLDGEHSCLVFLEGTRSLQPIPGLLQGILSSLPRHVTSVIPPRSSWVRGSAPGTPCKQGACRPGSPGTLEGTGKGTNLRASVGLNT